MSQVKKRVNMVMYDVSTSGAIADELGKLRAEIKALKDTQSGLEALLKMNKTALAEGDNYSLTISYGVIRESVDWKAIAAKLDPSHQLITAHTKRTVFDRINLKAHSK